MLRLYDLTVGQRFTFTDKHREKVFEVTSKDRFSVVYMDVATGEDRIALSNRKTFRMPVQLVTTNRVVELTEREVKLLSDLLEDADFGAESQSERNEINALHIKLTESAGRRIVLPEES